MSPQTPTDIVAPVSALPKQFSSRRAASLIENKQFPVSENPIVSFVPECFRPHEGVLEGVAARSAKDAWAVGSKYDHNNNDRYRPLTLHWDGKCWSEVWCPTMGTEAQLFAVAVVPPNHAWAVGRYGDFIMGGPRNQTFVLRWDGNFQVWQISPSPNFPDADNFLHGVSGTSPRDVWAVGHYEPDNGGWQTLVQHWDGMWWKNVSSPNVGGQNDANGLFGVAASSVEDVWAAGGGDGNKTLIERWDGKQWSVVPSPNAPDTRAFGMNQLLGIAVKPPTAWAVGYYDSNIIARDTLIVERGPGDWINTPHFNHGGQAQEQYYLRGVAVDPVGGAWAVGYKMLNINNVLVSGTHIIRYDVANANWNEMADKPNGSANGLSGVAAITENDVWAVGWYHDPNHIWPRCLIEHWDGNQWMAFP